MIWRPMRLGAAVILLVAATLLGSCCSPGVAVGPPLTDPALSEKDYLLEVVRHLYRWYLDEVDVEKEVERDHFVFWLRELHLELDPGDLSRFGEIVIPGLDIYITVKKSDYEIEYSQTRVSSDVYKIVNVARYPTPSVRPEEYREVLLSHSELREYVFLSRSRVRYPEAPLLKMMRAAVYEELKDEYQMVPVADEPFSRVVHLSPLSPVANEAWVFWEAGRLLLHFSSDLDLEHPEIWAAQLPFVRAYDIDEQTVVSLHEAVGSNAYLTRDQVGRALYNCIILGRRLEFSPPDE